MKIKSAPLVGVKAGPDDGLEEGEFIVYPSTFTRTPDSYGDVVAPGAFAESIKTWAESGNVLPGLYGHRLDDPDFFVAYATEMAEDEHGLRVRGRFDLDAEKARQVYRLVKGRRLSQLSFAYSVLSEGEVELDSGEKANELRKLEIHEFSFVPVGANQDTSVVAVKSGAEALRARLAGGGIFTPDQIDSLTKAHSSLAAVLAAVGETSTGSTASGTPAGKPPAADEALTGKSAARGEDPSATPSARARALASIALSHWV